MVRNQITCATAFAATSATPGIAPEECDLFPEMDSEASGAPGFDVLLLYGWLLRQTHRGPQRLQPHHVTASTLRVLRNILGGTVRPALRKCKQSGNTCWSLTTDMEGLSLSWNC